MIYKWKVVNLLILYPSQFYETHQLVIIVWRLIGELVATMVAVSRGIMMSLGVKRSIEILVWNIYVVYSWYTMRCKLIFP
jgi:hypothetical protein